MRRPWGHTRTYHEWKSLTPVVDALGAVVAVASVVVGAHAALFLILAAEAGETAAMIDCAKFFVAIAIANGLVDLLRHWRRHHG
jgi:hypothetical protein